MKKLLFIYVVDPRFQHAITGIAPPVGIMWLCEAVKDIVDTRVLDLSISKDVGADVEQAVSNYKPDIVGLSIRNINTTANPPHSFVGFVQKVVGVIRSKTSAEIIFGGGGFSLYPKKLLRLLDVKYGFVGQAENTLRKFLVDYAKGEATPGTYADSCDYIKPSGSMVGNAIDLSRYKDIGFNYPIQTKRGCSLSCVYCSYPAIEGRKYIYRKINDIKAELKILKKHGVKEFFLSDSVFNFPKRHCMEVVGAVMGLGIKWTAYVIPKNLTLDDLVLFKKSGCVGLQVTIDTLSEDTLKSYGKSFSTADIMETDRAFVAAGIPTYYWVNLGGPGETEETFSENLSLLGNLKPHRGWIGTGLLDLPYTPLRKITGRAQEAEPEVFMGGMPENYMQQIMRICGDHTKWFCPGSLQDERYIAWARGVKKKAHANYWVKA